MLSKSKEGALDRLVVYRDSIVLSLRRAAFGVSAPCFRHVKQSCENELIRGDSPFPLSNSNRQYQLGARPDVFFFFRNLCRICKGI